MHVDRSGFPVDATVVHDVNGQYTKKSQFFIRIGNATKAVDGDQQQKYIAANRPSG